MTLGMSAVAGAGLLIALATAPAIAGSAPAAAGAAGGCSASAHVDSQWATGQIVTVTITNTGTTAATIWTASFTLASGQSLASAWNAAVTTSGGAVTAANMPYNGGVAPGSSTSFGMQLNGVAAAPAVSCTNDASVPVSPSAGQSSQSSGADITVTEADNQRTVVLTVGQTLRVTLPANYHPTTASNSGLVRISSSGGFPTGQPLDELYRAATQGSVDLSTLTDDPCLHTTPRCAIPQKLWTVHVTILNPVRTLSEADNGTTITLTVPSSIRISLGINFHPTTVSGTALQLVSTTGGFPTGQPLDELYRTGDVGSVDISTITDFDCLHTVPRTCALPQALWRVHVNVVGIGG
jgi:hypothetical protein